MTLQMEVEAYLIITAHEATVAQYLLPQEIPTEQRIDVLLVAI